MIDQTRHARRIYVASSWRNPKQPDVVAALRRVGHEVYDFRNPEPGNTGFAWSSVDPNWQQWSPETFIPALHHPVAQKGFRLDKWGLDWCDTCVCVLPCGRSAHLEAGYAVGQGKLTLFLIYPEKFEPELMYLLGQGAATTIESLVDLLEHCSESSLSPDLPGFPPSTWKMTDCLSWSARRIRELEAQLAATADDVAVNTRTSEGLRRGK